MRGPLTLLIGNDAMQRIALDDGRAQNALDGTIRAGYRIEDAAALVLDGERTAKMCLRDAARGAHAAHVGDV